MRVFFLLVFLPFSLFGQGTFTPVSYNQASLGTIEVAEYIGDGKAAVINDGQVYELNFDSEFNFSIKFIENAGLNQDQLTSYDLNRDGKQDLFTLSDAGGPIYNYLSTPERFDYISPLRSGRAFTAQDFDDDGVSDLIIDGYVYHHNEDGSLEQIFRRSPINDYLFKTQHVMDVDQDGDLDVLVNLGQNIGFLERDTTERLDLQLISQFNESCTWMRILQTTEGPVVVYYSASAQRIRRIVFENGVYSTIDLVTDQPNYGFATTVGDLTGDGNDELILSNASAGIYYIMSYDPISGEVIYKINNSSQKQRFMIVDDMGDPKLLGITSTSLNVYTLDSELNVSLDKTSVGNMLLGTFVDIDGDGYTDMINSQYQRRYFGGSNFGNIAPFSVPEPGGVFIDFDNDGDADYVVGEYRYENIGNGMFGPPIDNPDYLTYPDPDIFFTNVIYEGDMDSDGDVDLLSYNIFGEPLLIHENINNEYFLDGVELADSDVISGSLKGIRLLDLDGDADDDILMIAASGMVWFKNNGGLDFDDGIVLFDGVPKPISFDISDADMDGFPDIVLDAGWIDAGTAKGETHLYRGSESGPMYANQLSQFGGYKYSKFIVYDSVGIEDIIMSDGNFLQVLRLDDFDQSSPQIKYVSGDFNDYGSYLVQDVDSDGDDDVIAYNSGGTALKYYLKDETDIEGLCPYEDVLIYNTEQLEQYRDRFGSCTELQGGLYVGGTSDWSDISELSALNRIQKIHGNVTFKFLLGSIGNFAELWNLDSIGGNLTMHVVRPNGLLGLRNLKTIGGNIRIDNLYGGTTSFDDLQALSHVGGGVTVQISDVKDVSRLFVGNKINGNVTLKQMMDIENVDFFENIDTINGSLEIQECIIYDLTQLKNIDYLTGLNIRASTCEQMELNLKVDSIIGDLVISLNGASDFVQTNSIRHIGEDFSITADGIGDWDELETVGGSFTGNTNSTGTTSFNKLRTVGETFGFGSGDRSDYSNFGDLKTIGRSLFINKYVKSLNGLQALDSIGSTLQSALSNNLVDMTDLSDDLYVGDEWILIRNKLLNVCDIPALCKHIEEGRTVEIRENASQCDDITDIKCIGSSVTGNAFFDFNQDGIRDEITDAPLSNITLRFDDNSDSLITSSNGYFQRFLQEGSSFDVSVSSLESWAFTTNNSYSIDSFIPGESPNVFDFGYYPEEETKAFASNLNTSLFLCDRPFELNAMIRNSGTNISNGYLRINYTQELKVSPEFTDFTSHDEDQRTMTISFEDWYPYFSEDYKIPFIAPSADELANEQMNITIQVIDIDENQVESLVHEDFINLALLCSYDPNDKLVSSTDKTGNIRIMEQDDELVYTIRFQNTGNYFAEDVRITDVISEDLDLSTFNFLASSHDVEITIRDREVTFMFEDIFLIDSTSSLLESQGFVSFSIKPYEIILDDQFDNQANIYFDFNDPIITNVAQSLVYDPSVAVSETINDAGVLVYPQPVNEKLTIDVSGIIHGEWHFFIVDISGKVMVSDQMRTENRVVLDMSSYHEGVYVLIIQNDNSLINQLITVLR